MKLTSDGITAHLPSGWEGAVTRQRAPSSDPTVPSGARTARAVDTSATPAVHLASFPLPPERGDYGSGAVEIMDDGDAFVALVEFGPESVGTALFAHAGVPRRLRLADFHPRALQRILPGQAGQQVFFTEQGRALCLYVVLGSLDQAVLDKVNGVLADLRIAPR